MLNEGLQRISNGTFTNCTSLQSIIIPSTVTKIGGTAFSQCENMREVVLNDGLQKIGDLAFCGCYALESITLPSTLADIDDSMTFYHCSSLREVELHEGLQNVGDKAFLHCTSLERFNFPCLSNRLNNIIQTKHYRIEAKIDDVREVVERRGSELFVPATIMDTGRHWNTIKQHLDRIVQWIRYYEVKEATALFELALWKAKIQVDDTNHTNRETCRIEVPGPVKDTILQYL